MKRPKITDFIKGTITNPSIELIYLKDYVKELEAYADKQDEAISVIPCCKPKGNCKHESYTPYYGREGELMFKQCDTCGEEFD